MDDQTIAQAVRTQIDEHGWAILAHEGDPTVAYTVGLRAYDHPELVVVGLPPDTACDVLDECAADVADGRRFEPRTKAADVLDGHDVSFLEIVDPKVREEACVGAALHFGADGFAAMQVVWPDRKGRFPGDEGADEEMARRQVLLG